MRYVAKFAALLLSTVFSISLLVLFSTAALYLFYEPQLPDLKALHIAERHIPLRIYSQDKQLIAEYGAKRRNPVNYQQIPPLLHQAFVAIEDARYYQHQGVDFKGILRALRSVLSSGHASQGASTITMQLARNAFLGREKTLDRKLKESLLALKMERSLSKTKILELYLNKIYLGNRAYGIAAAAQIYYGKDNLHELSLAQMAMIAGLPKAPSRYNPIANPQRAMIRRDYILRRMLQLGYINQLDYEQAVQEDNTASVHKAEIETYAPYLAEMVRSAIVEKYQDKAYTQGFHVYTTLDSKIQQHTNKALRQTLMQYDERHGYRGVEDHIKLNEYADPEAWLDKLATYKDVADMKAALVIQTGIKQARLLMLDKQMNGKTVDLQLAHMAWAKPFINTNKQGLPPQQVNQVLKPGDIIRVRRLATSSLASTENTGNSAQPTDPQHEIWQLTQVPKVGGALVVMNPKNGAIQAVMGGFDYEHSKFNRATQARRQPGSSFKPIVYAAAISQGFTPTSIVNDAPIPGTRENWQPKNFSGGYVGPTTLAEALAKSRNLVSIRLLRHTGIPYTIDYATRFGYAKKDLPHNLTLALGTGLTTPVQMATAYAAIANGGFKIEPYFINRIENNSGQVLYDAENTITRACGDNISYCPDSQAPAAPRIMNAQTNQHIVNMLHGVTRFGTAARAGKILKRRDIAGKTGTTNDHKDAWFCGFTPEYVAIAWAGFNNMAELGDKETSTKLALPMWTQLMQEVLRDQPEKPWATYRPLQTAQSDLMTETPIISGLVDNSAVDTPLTTDELMDNIGTDTTATQPAPVESLEIPEQLF